MTTEKSKKRTTKPVGVDPADRIAALEQAVRTLLDRHEVSDQIARALELRGIELEARVTALESTSANPLGLKE